MYQEGRKLSLVGWKRETQHRSFTVMTVMKLKILVETNMGTLPILIIFIARTLLKQFRIAYWYTTSFIEIAR
jgi:hypothetical protein